jgi:hypothetical protein
MRRVLAGLLVSALVAPSAAARAEADVAVAFTCTPQEVEIGQPIACVLRVEHPAGARVTLAEGEAADGVEALPLFADPDGSQHAQPWVVVDGPARHVEALGADGRFATELRWTALALEPGARSPGVARVEVELEGGVLSRSARASDVVVHAALAEGEDAPRPWSDFPDAPAPVAGSGVLIALGAWALVAAALCLVALVAFVRGRRRPTVAPAPTLDERLAGLERDLMQGFDAGGEALERGVRAFGYGASALLRGAVDRRLGAAAPGTTDEEWLARIERDKRVEPRLAADLRRFLAALEPIEYGAWRPTRFAFDELAQRARALGARIDGEVRPPAAAPARERAA